MEKTLSLDELGKRLAKVDELILGVAKRRMELALQVERRKSEEAKLAGREELIRRDKEDERISGAVTWATQHDLNPNFAASLEHLLINESCHEQMMQMQESQKRSDEPTSEDEEYEAQKRNLKTLTEHWAPSYDTEYDKGNFGTRAYKRLEAEILEREIMSLQHRCTMLDLGCATGRIALRFCNRFAFSVGYDISSHMVDRAYLNSREWKGQNVDLIKTDFRRADIEKGIDVQDNTVSYVVMNLGTASDVRDIKGVIAEIRRVLKPGGRFFLSFYNREALAYRWEFIPWPLGLVASVNIYKHCLEVHDPTKGGKMSVYAQAYTTKEVEELLAGSDDLRLITYPAISAITPSVLFENQPDAEGTFEAVDRTLLDSNMGAYIIATGAKPL